MSMFFTKLFSSITESTIWSEDDKTRIVWITMLAMADRHGRVWASVPGLANRARVSVDSAVEALKKFQEPDQYSRTKDFDGRRIEEIEGGWRLLNYEKYRAVRDQEAIKESKRNHINRKRAEEKAAKSNGVENVDRRRHSTEADQDQDQDQDLLCELEVYGAYPKKVGKPKALVAIRKAIAEFGGDHVLERTLAYAEARQGQNPQFTPHPATWFNAHRFNDDPATWVNGPIQASVHADPNFDPHGNI